MKRFKIPYWKDLTRGFKHWESLPFDQVDLLLPSSPGFYAIKNKNKDTVIYIGTSKDLYRRWKTGHDKAIACVREGATHAMFIVIPSDVDDNERYYWESQWIQLFNPVLNQQIRAPQI